MSDTASLLSLIRDKCGRANWYSGWDFRQRTSLSQSTTVFTSAFAYAVATEQQLRETERVIGFPLPSLLGSLYIELANGGFGPGDGLRGGVGGYGTVGFLLPNGQTFRNDETLVKYHARGQLVDLDAYAHNGRRKHVQSYMYPTTCGLPNWFRSVIWVTRWKSAWTGAAISSPGNPLNRRASSNSLIEACL